MLTTQTYLLALMVLYLSALGGLILIARALPERWPSALRWGLIGLLGGLLMTPALPSDSATYHAPALIIALFNTLFGEGWVSAVPVVAQLVLASVAGAVGGVLLGLLRSRRRSSVSA